MTPTTAALIASCDQAEFIVESVVSVARQVDHIIVVDDASVDDSVERIRALSVSNLTVIELPTRGGVSAAFAAAVEASREDVLIFQGGDDLSLAGRAAAHVAALADPAVAVSTARPQIIGTDGGRLPDSVALEFSPPPAGADPLARLVLEGNFICAPSTAVRRVDYERWGGFARNIDLLQDYLLWMLALADGQLSWSAAPLVQYRKHSRNTSRSYVGLDSARRRRHAAELEYVVSTFVERASDDVLTRLSTAIGISHSPRGGAHTTAVRALILLSHPQRTIQRRGLHLLFEVSRDSDADTILSELNLSRLDIDAYAQAVDHENSGEVARALQLGWHLETGPVCTTHDDEEHRGDSSISDR